MVRAKKNKKVEEIKDLEMVKEETTVEPVVEEIEADDKEIVSGKDYVVVLGTPSFYVIKLEDGTMKTIQGSNTYKRGDIVRL